ncbi:DNA/RNA helicase domain-containing protein, partial [Parabacteroides goldsteinii]
QQARGTQQTGILISKVSARFKPLAVHVLPQSEDNAVHWFLEDKTDVRSSNYLEEAATEIQVQGLEVDFACVLWDADMRYDNGKWTFWKFNGKTQWTPEKNYEPQKYMLNAYRVLLTRARQGMVICVPKGNERTTHEGFPEDPTRQPSFYDSTYEYFKRLGLAEI